jgi:hypothetical protein
MLAAACDECTKQLHVFLMWCLACLMTAQLPIELKCLFRPVVVCSAVHGNPAAGHDSAKAGYQLLQAAAAKQQRRQLDPKPRAAATG